jgi:TPR repeat protein
MLAARVEEPRRFRRGDLILKRYRLVGELGHGCLGVVYRCLDQVTGMEVALKTLPAERFRDPVGMDEIRDNFRWVSRLVHQHIVAIRTLEQDSVTGASYVVLECVEGRDLRQWRLHRGGKVSLQEALPVLRQVATALDFAHSQKIFHRDLKPSKVLVRADETVKVLFFGSAAPAQSKLYPTSRFRCQLKRAEPQAGPQKWRGQYQGAGRDQFALAVMAYELLAGKLPFGLTYRAVICRGGLPEEPARPEGLDARAWSALVRGLAKDHLDRFATCAEFVSELAGRQPAEVVRVAPIDRVAKAEPHEAVEEAKPAISRALRLGGKSFGDEIAAAPKPSALPALEESAKAPVPETAPAPPTTPTRPVMPLGPGPEVSRPGREPAKRAWSRRRPGWGYTQPAWTKVRTRWAKRGLHTRVRSLGQKAARHSRLLGIGMLSILVVAGLGTWYSYKVREEGARRRAELAKAASRSRYWYLKASLGDLEAEAARTNVAAEIELGDRYCWGLAGRVDYPVAFKSYGQAAALKEPVAYGRMGNLCQEAPALGGGRDVMMRWYEQGAVLGDAISQIDWGNAIRQGNAGSEPPETAQRLFTVAIPRLRELAAVGDTMAMDYLGGVYWDGLGVPQDLSEATKWFRQAAMLGNSSAMNHLALAYAKGRGVSTDRAEAQKWFRRAAELGDGAAMYNLADAYALSSESPEDQAEAANWMRKAAELGLAPAMSRLGSMYAKGTGVPQDDKEAWAWFEKAATAGNAEAMTWLGRFCETGRAFGADYDAALKWYRKAAALGDLRSTLRLKDLNITERTQPSLNAGQ